ncbi:hypothetical protein MAPG_06445 [Magnaporthiopsis poae ATCC 64411]|uniref:Nephrocystin 3-like N-terminal domain-containing protein n=1 Tax=Magnaporthiopsis poae (strain ATCC 64411 / 73-15) TaxID=644358 RepID=A0A0C4E219_MAGP6|nr:hypothetical protein MAPG_06445 [Magnaporthiopsis poae ATCC 64411]
MADDTGQAVAVKTLSLAEEAWRQSLAEFFGGDPGSVEETLLKLENLEDMLGEAHNAKASHDAKQLTFEFRGGRYAYIDIFGQVVRHINALKGVIDSGVALDVSGQAALPWAVVKFILGFLGNYHDQKDAVLSSLASVDHVLVYYRQFESLYFRNQASAAGRHREPTQSPTEDLKSAILEVYSQCFRILRDTTEWFGQSADKARKGWKDSEKTDARKTALKRSLRNLQDWARKTGKTANKIFGSSARYSDGVAKIEAGRAKVDMWANLVMRQDQLRAMDLTDRTHALVEKIEHAAFLRGLSDISSLKEHAALSETILMGSAIWFPRNSKYQEWLMSPKPAALWIHGSLGSGKSTLVCLAIDGFLEGLRPNPTAPVVFFYGVVHSEDGSTWTTRTADDCARDMLRQLVQLNPSSGLPELSSYVEGNKPSGKTCLKLIEEIIDASAYVSVTFAIDALDRMTLPRGRNSRVALTPGALLDGLVKLSLSKAGKCLVRILVSSQHRDDIPKSVFEDKKDAAIRVVEIDVDSESPPTIRQFIESQVSGWIRADFLPGEAGEEGEKARKRARAAVVESVTLHAGRMYLWAQLTLNNIRGNQKLKKETDLLDELKKLKSPSDITKMYKAIWGGLSGDSRATRVLQLLCCAGKRVATAAVLGALGGADKCTADDIVKSSGGFITEDHKHGVLALFHPSVKQFLGEQAGYEAQAHTAVAEMCLSTLSEFYQDRSQGRRGRSRERQGASSDARRRRSRMRSRSGSRRRGQTRDGLEDPQRKPPGRRQRQRGAGLEGRDCYDHVLQDFNEYADIYWATHASKSGDPSLGERVARFLGTVHERELWIESAQTRLSQRPHGFYGHVVEQELKHCWSSHPATSLLVSAVYGFATFIEGEVARAARDSRIRTFEDLRNDDGLSTFHLAAKFGHIPVLNLLARLTPTPAIFLEPDEKGNNTTAMEYALRNLRTAPEPRDLEAWLKLKARSGFKVWWVERLKEWYYSNGDREVAFIRECRLVAAALQNPFCAQELLELLRPKLKMLSSGELPDMEADAVDKGSCREAYQILLQAAVQYAGCSVELLRQGLSMCDKHVTEAVLVAAARWRNTERVPWRSRRPVWDYLVSGTGTQRLTREVIRAAIKAGDADLTRYLLELVPQLVLSPEMLEHAVTHRWEALRLIKALLDTTPGEKMIRRVRIITASMLEAMSGNQEQGGELLRTLREMSPSAAGDTTEPDLILKTAFRTGNWPFLEELVQTPSRKPRPSYEKVASALVESLAQPFCVSEASSYALYRPENQRDKQCEAAVSRIVDHFMDGKWEGLDGIPPLAEYQGPAVMKRLLALAEFDDTALASLLAAAACNKTYGLDIFKLVTQVSNGKVGKLLEHNDLHVVKQVISRGHWQVFEHIQKEHADILAVVPEPDLRNAASNPDVRVARFIFSSPIVTGRPALTVEMADLVRAALNSDAVLDCLMGMPDAPEYRPLRLLKAIAEGCGRTVSLRRALEESGRNRKQPSSRYIFVDLAHAAIGNKHGIDMLTFVLLLSSVGVTAGMLERAAANRTAAPEMLRVLLNRCEDDRVSRLITTRVRRAAERNTVSGLEALRILRMEEDFENERKRKERGRKGEIALNVLLQRKLQ